MNKEPGKSVDFINDPSKIKVGIVRARFNSAITEKMAINSEKRLKELGVKNIINHTVPGSFEIPFACNKILEKDIDGIIAIGCLIKGETDHYKYISSAVTNGLINLTINNNIYIANCVLNLKDITQAQKRLKSKGLEAVNALVKVKSNKNK